MPPSQRERVGHGHERSGREMVFRLQDGHGKVASRDPPWIPRGSCKKKTLFQTTPSNGPVFKGGLRPLSGQGSPIKRRRALSRTFSFHFHAHTSARIFRPTSSAWKYTRRGVWRTTGSLPHEGTRTDTGVKGTLPSAPRGTTQATKFGVNQVYIMGYLCARFDAGSSYGSCASMDGPPVGRVRDPREDLGSRGNSPFL